MNGNPYDVTDSAEDMLDGTAETEGPAASAGARSRPKSSPYQAQMLRTNAFLGMLLLAAAGAIYGLALRKGPATASADQQTLESQVDGVILRIAQQSAGPGTPGAGKMTSELLQTFYGQVVDRQVPLKMLRKNPFAFVRPACEAAPAAGERSEQTAPAPAMPETQETYERALAVSKALRLQSIMMSARGGGTAVISNNLLTVGQQIECFTVKSITPKTVVLAWQDREFVLTMP